MFAWHSSSYRFPFLILPHFPPFPVHSSLLFLHILSVKLTSFFCWPCTQLPNSLSILCCIATFSLFSSFLPVFAPRISDFLFLASECLPSFFYQAEWSRCLWVIFSSGNLFGLLEVWPGKASTFCFSRKNHRIIVFLSLSGDSLTRVH